MYWNKKPGNLAALIDRADRLPKEERNRLGAQAKKRVKDRYAWEKICEKYETLFLKDGELF